MLFITKPARKVTHSYGFTLIELLVVISIIGVMTSAVLATLSEARAKARDSQRYETVRSIINALELYQLQYGKYPCHNTAYSYNPNFLKPLVDAGYLPAYPKDPLDDGVYGIEYQTFKRVVGGKCGEIAEIGYDRETGAPCILGGFQAQYDSLHCHIHLGGPLPCPDPYMIGTMPTSCTRLKDTQASVQSW